MIQELTHEHVAGLATELQELGYNVEACDIIYNLLDREEFIYIDSELIEPTGDLPAKFGIYRGYAGGGVHSGARLTEVYKLPKNKQAKALKALEAIKSTFWQILDDIEREQADQLGYEPEVWESVKL